MVAFTAVIVGWALSLDYSAKLFTMTFVLVIMGSEKASGEHAALLQILQRPALIPMVRLRTLSAKKAPRKQSSIADDIACPCDYASCGNSADPGRGVDAAIRLSPHLCHDAWLHHHSCIRLAGSPMQTCVMHLADAYLVALTRTSGIVGGVVVMLVLSVIIFPKSASHQVRTLHCDSGNT